MPEDIKTKESPEVDRNKSIAVIKNAKIIVGKSYLVKEHSSSNAYDLFNNITNQGFKGLCITRTTPEVIKESYNISPESVILSSQSQNSLKSLLQQASEFIKKNKESVILLERPDYLAINNGFEETLKFIYSMNDIISGSNSIFVMHLNPSVFSSVQQSLIEQEFNKLPCLKAPELTEDLKEIVDYIAANKKIDKAISFKDITKKFKITKTTTRRRINRLKELNIIEIRKKGRFKILAVRDNKK